MIKWDQALVQSVHDYENKHKVTIQKALADLKLPVGSFYNARGRFGKRIKSKPAVEIKRTYNKKSVQAVQIPMKLEMASSNSSNKIVILITDRSQVKNILAELF